MAILKGDVTINWGKLNPKQIQFAQAKEKYVAYGGARGGGKSHVARWLAVYYAIFNPGMTIMMARRHYEELKANLVDPIKKWIPSGLYSYNTSEHVMTFYNGSIIRFWNWEDADAEHKYQGQEFDTIFLDEATQFTEDAFNFIRTCLRSANNKYPRHLYCTCNPGGCGHRWVKRIFVDREFKRNPDPRFDEDPNDYLFIPATVFDNPDLLENTPDYLKVLNGLPERIREAHLYGNWDLMGGAYFSEFSEQRHTCPDFTIPQHWKRYRSFDYGLDMLSVKWWAVDEDGRNWCYREYDESRLTIDKAAKKILDLTPDDENIVITYMPPDMKKVSSDSGKSYQEVFAENGIAGVFADNNREKGHLIMKMMLQPKPLNDEFTKTLFKQAPTELPMLMIFKSCKQLIDDIRNIQQDEDKPNDCATEPHDVTHSVDSARYFLAMRTLPTTAVLKVEEKSSIDEYFEQENKNDDYDYFYSGDITEEYLNYGY